MSNNKNEIFQAWFNRKWAEWDAYNERRSTQFELAEYLGITRSAVAQYTSGRQVADNGNLLHIANKFGDEIYEIVGVEKPTPELPPDFITLADDIRSAIKKSGFEIGSDEADQILIDKVEVFLSRKKENL